MWPRWTSWNTPTVEVKLISFPTMTHGFLNFPRFAKDATPGMQAIVDAQKAAFA